MRGAFLPSLTIAVGASFWGLYWLPVRAVAEIGIDGVWPVLIFNLPAAIAAGVVFALRPSGGGAAMMVAGALAGLGLALYAMGFLYTSVVRATLLFYLTPFWATLIAMAVLGERPGLARWSALALAMIGLVLVLGPGAMEGGFGLGEAFGLASGVSWAGAAVLIRRAGTSGNGLVFYQFVAVVVVSAIAAMALGQAAPDPDRIAAAMSVTVLGFSLAILLSIYAIFWAVALVSPGRSGLLMMTEVVVAVISAALLAPEETLSAAEWIGAALIVGAGVVEVLGGPEPETKADRRDA